MNKLCQNYNIFLCDDLWRSWEWSDAMKISITSGNDHSYDEKIIFSEVHNSSKTEDSCLRNLSPLSIHYCMLVDLVAQRFFYFLKSSASSSIYRYSWSRCNYTFVVRFSIQHCFMEANFLFDLLFVNSNCKACAECFSIFYFLINLYVVRTKKRIDWLSVHQPS